ncbi:MAG: hypothetical protein NVS3B18_15420 [Candidatus Dormibacteria bacterium]
MQLSSQASLDGAIRAAGGHDEQEVVALLGEPERRQRLAHDRLCLGESAAQLRDQRDVGQRIPRQPHAVGGHDKNVHGEQRGRIYSPTVVRALEAPQLGEELFLAAHPRVLGRP